MRDLGAPPEELPEKRRRYAAGGAGEDLEIGLRLRVTTPVLGGAAKLRQVDKVDLVRAATIRGHLRFWWRALLPVGRGSSQDLWRLERQIWGGVAPESEGGPARSSVELRVAVEQVPTRDDSDIGFNTAGAYALWPARRPTAKEQTGGAAALPAPRYMPGWTFSVSLHVPGANSETVAQVRRALCAWVLFGGYGSRTRRGLGSLTVAAVLAGGGEPGDWLPAADKPLAEELARLLGEAGLEAIEGQRRIDSPALRGAQLLTGAPVSSAESAWLEALNALRDFRQGVASGARQPPSAQAPRRPGRSNWPEPDKIRLLSPGGPWAHSPRHSADPAWPRAGFGLPIVTHFKPPDDRAQREPPDAAIVWRRRGEEGYHNRLASPLIVKPLAMADGTYRPAALWLFRGTPADGEAGLLRNERWVARSEAAFGMLAATGDPVHFAPMRGATSLRESYLGWLEEQGWERSG